MLPELRNAAERVKRPAMISPPPTNWIIAAHHDGDAMKPGVEPPWGSTGQANSVDTPWKKNNNPIAIR